MRIMLITLMLSSLMLSQSQFLGLWEGPKEDRRFDNIINNFGPIKIEQRPNGQLKSTFMGSYYGDSDNELFKTVIKENSLTIMFRSWGHPLLKVELKNGQLIGTLEHHGMTESLTMNKTDHRSSDQIIEDFNTHPNTFKAPSPSQLVRIILEKEIELALQIFRNIKDRKSDFQGMSKSEINRLGYNLLSKKMVDKAITVFKLNTSRFPKDANSFDSLGEGYYEKGDYLNAERMLRKSLSLNPTDQIRQNSLKLLKKMGLNIAKE